MSNLLPDPVVTGAQIYAAHGRERDFLIMLRNSTMHKRTGKEHVALSRGHFRVRTPGGGYHYWKGHRAASSEAIARIERRKKLQKMLEPLLGPLARRRPAP